MNKDDEMRGDEEDDETPEEMVNRSLAEALESQQRYMEMFHNSAHVLQVLSRFMSDPIVVHDLEVLSDDGTASTTPASSSTSSSPPTTQTHSINDEVVESHRMFGGCTNTVTYRGGRLRSARPNRLGTLRQREQESRVHFPGANSRPETISRSSHCGSDMGDGDSSCHHHGGTGDNDSPQKKVNEKTHPQPTASNYVSTSCQTQTNKIGKNNIGIGNTEEKDARTTTTHQHESIGVSTQTSINNAMSEISKAADTIRMARTMLRSMNIGTASGAQEMNNNNHEICEGDNENDGKNTGVDSNETKISSQPREEFSQGSLERNMPDNSEAIKIKSIFVNVRPSSNASSSSASDYGGSSSILETNQSDELAEDKVLKSFRQNSVTSSFPDFSSVDNLGHTFNTRNSRRQITTVTAGIGGTTLDNSQFMDKAPKCFVFEPNKIPKLSSLCLPMQIDNRSDYRLNLTMEMFQHALRIAISNLEKEGLWSSQSENNTNVKLQCNNECYVPESKVNSNGFAISSPIVATSAKDFQQIPSSTSRISCGQETKYENKEPCLSGIENIHTIISIFDTADIISSSGDERPKSVASSKKSDMLNEKRETDIESTYGHSSSVHLSPVVAFNEDDYTDDEESIFVYDSIMNEDRQYTSPCEDNEQKRLECLPNVNGCFGEPCTPIVLMENSNERGIGSGDCDELTSSPNRITRCDRRFSKSKSPAKVDDKPLEEIKGTRRLKRKKPSFFKRLTSVIAFCSSKKK